MAKNINHRQISSRISQYEGSSITLTSSETARWDAGDEEVIREVAARLAPGEYSIYAADGGPLLENIEIGL